MKDKRKDCLIIAAICYPMILWFAIKIAPYTYGGFAGLIENIGRMETEGLRLCSNTLKSIGFITLIYTFVILLIYTSIRNYRYDEEFGSARWERPRVLDQRYRCREDVCGLPDVPIEDQNFILTQNVRIGMDVMRHNLYLNIMVLGGVGTFKTTGVIYPNILQANASFVVTDPKGEIFRNTGSFLRKKGYAIKWLDLKNPDRSMNYNPFWYFRNDDDVLKFVDTFFATNTDKNAMKSDPIWDEQAKNVMLAYLYYLYHEAPREEQNFDTLMMMANAAKVSEDDEDYESPVDLLFTQLEKINPQHIALGFYKAYRIGAGRSLKSVLLTLNGKLSKFNLTTMKKLTYTDELDLRSIGKTKTALFVILPDNDASYNFMASMIYMQIIQQLYDEADSRPNGRLPVHVRFLWDEFANIALPDDYQKIISTCRGRNISITHIIQNTAQLKKLFKDDWQNILGNCDNLLFLGSNELEMCEYVSKLCDKETIDMKEYGTTSGSQGHSNKNFRKQARDLITPGEVRRLDRYKAILIMRGEDPCIDHKMNMKKHKNFKEMYTGNSNVPPYQWGMIDRASGGTDLLDPATYQGRLTRTDQPGKVEIFTKEEMENIYAA